MTDPIHLTTKASISPAPAKKNLLGSNLPDSFRWSPASRTAERAVSPSTGELDQSGAKVPATVVPEIGSGGWARAHNSELSAWHSAYDSALAQVSLATLSAKWGRPISVDEAETILGVGAKAKAISETPAAMQSAAKIADQRVPSAAPWRLPSSPASVYFPTTDDISPQLALDTFMSTAPGSEKTPSFVQRHDLVDYSGQAHGRRAEEANARAARHTSSE